MKVCGITDFAGVDSCLKLGVDHLGFNFVAASRRFVTTELARQLAERADQRCRLVGVFMNPSRDEVLHTLERVPLDAVQLHGSESPEFCAALPVPVWKVFAVGPGWDETGLSGYAGVAARLFDTALGGVSGGTGRTFDWDLLPANPGFPWFLAGGLNPENLAAAIGHCRPDGIDLNSGVESAPGIKDFHKLEAALRVAREFDKVHGGEQAPRQVSTWLVEGVAWPCWTPPEPRPGVGFVGLESLLEQQRRVVLDITAWQGNSAELAAELIRWQLVSREKGWHLKFRVSDSLLAALVRFSYVPLLEIID